MVQFLTASLLLLSQIAGSDFLPHSESGDGSGRRLVDTDKYEPTGCESGYFQCHDGLDATDGTKTKCVNRKTSQCDGHRDCMDWSDEYGCFTTWSKTNIYVTGLYVQHNDKIYMSQKNGTDDVEPGTNDEKWMMITTWSNTEEYKSGHKVLYGGKIYISQEDNNAGAEPGTNDEKWMLITTWSNTEEYKSWHMVFCDDEIYISQQYVPLGNKPSEDNDGTFWKLISTWSNTEEYKSGQKVLYGGKIYISQQDVSQSNLLPSKDNNEMLWKLSMTTWSRTEEYKSGHKVLYGGKIYISQEDNNAGAEPGTNDEKWMLKTKRDCKPRSGVDDGNKGTGRSLEMKEEDL